MYSLIRSVRARQLILTEAPSAVLSLLIAELFYKFGSFTLECMAFLTTWFAMSGALSLALKAIGSAAAEHPTR
jgi:hypothetical protein